MVFEPIIFNIWVTYIILGVRMNPLWLDIGRGLSLSLKLSAAGFIYYIYFKDKRKSALCLSLAWLSAALSIGFDFLQVEELNAFFESLFASLLFYGILKILEEEGKFMVFRELFPVSFTPFLVVSYFLGLNGVRNFDGWMFSIGISYAVSGLFIFFSGTLVAKLIPIYGRRARILSPSLMFYGIHEMDYPFLRPVDWFAPIGFFIGALLTFLISFSIVRFVLTEEFRKLKESGKVKEVEIESGILIVNKEEYEKLKDKLKDVTVLAFLRDLENVPKTWETFFITNIVDKERKTISPTDLAKMTELSNRYLKSSSSIGSRGIIVIDCLEYLLMYNKFSSVMKFLSALRDFILINNGTLILVTEQSAWTEKQWILLRRLLE